MKQTDNDKMDLLLRDLAKREGAGTAMSGAFEAGRGDQSHTDHLDADELSAYAERALPDVTRARYTAHLADCTRCRKIVTELTLAAGTTLAGSGLDKPASTTLWEKFGAFFAAPVLRYAVPALALFAVVAITFIALRREQQASFVAQNQEAPAPAAVLDSEETSVQGGQADRPAAATLSKPTDESARKTGTREDKKDKPAEKEEMAQGKVAANSVSLAEAKDLPASKLKDAASQPAFAPEPTAPPSKQLAKTSDAQRADEVRQQEQMAELDAAKGRKNDPVQANDKAERSATTPQSRDAMVARKRTATFGAAGRGEGGVANVADSNEDVRTVAGRRFRRQGQSWVDTAYDPSRSSIVVARGSEQYRALIADEPGIRTIADQLQGEVVVVWKGNTYRIR